MVLQVMESTTRVTCECTHSFIHSLTHWKQTSFAFEWHHHKVWRDVLAVEEDAGGWEAVKEKTLLTLLIASIRQLWPHWLTFQDRIHLMHPKNQRQWPQLIRYQCFSLDPLIFQPSALLLYYVFLLITFLCWLHIYHIFSMHLWPLSFCSLHGMAVPRKMAKAANYGQTNA